ncbi:MAG: methyltransferase domain-containing protein [Thiobacillus sp.]|nr:methyltransferase domain-containing protein [Thiobacillus sp.]
MDRQTRQFRLRETFNAAAPGYDSPALRFFVRAAGHLADSMALAGDEHLLDVACGTGNVSLACAVQLDRGRVTGVDLSDGMLAQARAKAVALQLDNVSFQCGDLEALDVGDRVFDGAVCGFGLFFMSDMEAALRTIARYVRAEGKIGISSFTGAVMEPLASAFLDRIQAYGVEIPPLSWKRLDDVAKHRAVFAAAGVDTVVTRAVQVGYDLLSFDEWWDILWFSGFRGMLNQLSPDELAQFRRDHRSEIERHAVNGKNWLQVEVLISVGHKA